MTLDSEPIKVRHLGFDESTIAPDNHYEIDISKELELLEKHVNELREKYGEEYDEEV